MSASTPPQVPMEVTCEAVRDALASGADMLLIDCREPDEHAIVHIAAATLLPMSQLRERLDELALHRERNVVVHCHHGGRSLKVATWLRGQGFARAQSMAGGIDEWARRIDPQLPRY